MLDLVLQKVKAVKTIEQDIYVMLVSMFPTIIAPALEIIDHGRITKLVCQKSKRHFYMIKDPGTTNNIPQANRKNESRDVVASDDQANTHLVYGEFCFSYFFAKECLSLSESGSAALSKYILAVKIAEALSNTEDISGASPPGVIVVKEIDDRDFAPLLL